MKNLLLSLGLVLAAFASISQTQNVYQVLRVAGNVFCQRLHKNLETGDKINDKDILTFQDASAHLSVMGPQGRKVVRNSTQNVNSELKSLLTDIISLEKKHTASRGFEEGTKIVLAIKKIKTDLSFDTLLILGSGIANFSSSDLTLNDTSIMECRYRSRHENVERRISNAALLDLSRGSMFTPDQQPVKIQLIYYPSKENIFDNPPETLGSFMPVYGDNEKMKKEAVVIIGTLKGQTKHQLVAELKKYFEDEYWPVLEENLIRWMTESNLLQP